MAGVIICPASESSTDVNPLLDHGVPVVIVDRKIDDDRVDTVLVDNEHGAAVATHHLISSGYHRIACVSGPRTVSTGADRLAGYESALRAAAYDVDPDLVRCTDFRERGGYGAMGELLALTDPPDAVFVTNNLMTLGALQYIAEHRIPIPQTLGVVGFDDLPWPYLFGAGLSTVRQPAYEVGRAAGELMVRRMTGTNNAPSTVVLPTELIVRDSSVPADRAAMPAD
jgi:LacI family transcriptional regulator